MGERDTIPDPTFFAGRNVTVMGLGSFGGGTAAVRFLAERGARVLVSDQRPQAQLLDSVSELSDLPEVDWKLGAQDWSHFADADFVVVNPAVPPHHPIVRRLEDEGVRLTSEMNLFWQLNQGRVIAVTGSNGKSTTTALIHSMIQASGQRCWLGGNIGRSLLPHLNEIATDDWVVLELSSFQLHMLNRIQARPDIAVITNFAPNHLDWHGTLDEYRVAKQSILRWQTADDWCVTNGEDTDISEWPHAARAVRVFGSRNVAANEIQHSGEAWLDESGLARIRINEISANISEFPICDWCSLRGRHNVANALLSATAVRLAEVNLDGIRQGLQQFEALPHRLQFVGEVAGRKFFNDSISTTPESTIAAIDSFEEPVVLLAGGYDKKVDLRELAQRIAGRTKAVSLLGQTASALRDFISEDYPSLPLAVGNDLASAFEWAVGQSSSGDVILLSPGCASYDWFKSFVDRGEQFCQLVRNRAGESSARSAGNS
ncbi:MAG: UDP-N-acetylmuramoyl-L-alanine--D-glutamate ligase [Planctomycetota bacterium]|nr:UDP-N-acetylmuramoyl-L-alanine--D-glutamate ligase [Planctomycetota bacterium]